MSESNNDTRGSGGGIPSQEAALERYVERHLSAAGARDDAPAHLRAQIEHHVQASWRELLRARRRRTQLRLMAAGIAFCAVGALAFAVFHRAAESRGPAAIFLASKGEVEIEGNASGPVTTGGQALAPGTRIRTGGDGRVLLSVGTVSLRIGRTSDVRMTDDAHLAIDHGVVYVDSRFARQNSRSTRGAESPYTIVTPLGNVAHDGTQYEVDAQSNQLTINVRDGSVRWSSGSTQQRVVALQQLTILADGSVHVGAISPYAGPWSWAADLVPDFPIDGRTLTEFFDWFAKETGARVHYANDVAREQARKTRLNGSLAGLSPPQALQAILATTQFSSVETSVGVFTVDFQRAARDKLLPDGALPPAAPKPTL